MHGCLYGTDFFNFDIPENVFCNKEKCQPFLLAESRSRILLFPVFAVSYYIMLYNVRILPDCESL